MMTLYKDIKTAIESVNGGAWIDEFELCKVVGVSHPDMLEDCARRLIRANKIMRRVRGSCFEYKAVEKVARKPRKTGKRHRRI